MQQIPFNLNTHSRRRRRWWQIFLIYKLSNWATEQMSKIPKAMMLTSIFIFAESFKFSHAFRYDRIYIIVKSKRNRDTDKVRESNGGAVCSLNFLSSMIHVQSSNLSSAVEIQRFKTIHSSKERQQISRKKRQTTHKILNTIKQKRTRSSLSIFVRAEPSRIESSRVEWSVMHYH